MSDRLEEEISPSPPLRPSWRRRLRGPLPRRGPVRAFVLQATGSKGGHVSASLDGRLDLAGLELLLSALGGMLDQWRPRAVSLDLSGVTYLDSAGATALTWLEGQAASRGIKLRLIDLSPTHQGVKDMLGRGELDQPPLRPATVRRDPIEQLGEGWLAFSRDFYQVVSFLGDFLGCCAQVARHPRQVRWPEVWLYMEKVGVEGLPIVALISYLLGLIMAFMSSLQLQPFGANIYVANLVAVAMVKELGPMMTAVLVAGRSGSAFAAEIGTMRVNEEVDALVVMGYDPLIFLALPKVLAAIFTVPMLTLFSDVVAIAGGLTVGVLGMDITPAAYIQQTMKTLYAQDILTGALKSGVFALLIAGIGCQRGFMVRGGAQAVGEATTSAVVAAMFLIIVADSVFAIVLHYWG